MIEKKFAFIASREKLRAEKRKHFRSRKLADDEKRPRGVTRFKPRILEKRGVYFFSSYSNRAPYTAKSGQLAVPIPINRIAFIDVFARSPKYNHLVKIADFRH
jgi:hypothetical protein